jgi:hypothetical protein
MTLKLQNKWHVLRIHLYNDGLHFYVYIDEQLRKAGCAVCVLSKCVTGIKLYMRLITISVL